MEMLNLILRYVLFVIWVVTNVEGTGMMKVEENADLNADAARINEAYGVWNTNEGVFLEILPKRGCAQRNQIYQKLDAEKRQSTWQYNYYSGDAYIAIMSCFFCGPDYYSLWFREAIKSEDTETLIEMLVLLSFDDVKNTVLDSEVTIGGDDSSAAEEKKKLRDLWNDKMSDDFKNWGNEIITRNRDKNTETDQKRAKEDAQALLAEKDGGFGNNRQKMDEILCERSKEQARLTLEEFKTLNDDTSLIDEIDDQLDDELEEAYKSLITYIIEGKENYLAMRIHDAMEGIGTDDKTLTRLIIYLAESDLVEVNTAFQAKYEGVSIAERVKEETSGFQRDFTLAFMGLTSTK